MDPEGQLMTNGTVAAANIATALDLPKEHVPKIEQAIKDEISAMSAHFTMAFADIQTQYEIETAKIKSAYTYVSNNRTVVGVVLAVFFAVGLLVGHIL